eukprot:GHVU01090610.1.p1 GENE.GHVU01090610.1~~GHVU01090610.1.p1  ORF type:complete len:182 (+),score=35.11 GHVU01090610.1:121-666(+)
MLSLTLTTTRGSRMARSGEATPVVLSPDFLTAAQAKALLGCVFSAQLVDRLLAAVSQGSELEPTATDTAAATEQSPQPATPSYPAAASGAAAGRPRRSHRATAGVCSAASPPLARSAIPAVSDSASGACRTSDVDCPILQHETYLTPLFLSNAVQHQRSKEEQQQEQEEEEMNVGKNALEK